MKVARPAGVVARWSVLAVALFVVGPAWAHHDPSHAAAGDWLMTFHDNAPGRAQTGTLHLKSVTKADAEGAAASMGTYGTWAFGECGSGATQFVLGTFQRDTDNGPVVGCISQGPSGLFYAVFESTQYKVVGGLSGTLDGVMESGVFPSLPNQPVNVSFIAHFPGDGAAPEATTKLIVGLGDSLASGEGNPDTEKTFLRAATWQSVQCDRSGNSFEARVVRMLEQQKGMKIDFVYLACSGASIPVGLLGPYAGINPGKLLPAQVAEARRLVGDRKPDAVLLSIGVNDLEFGDVIRWCAEQRGDCMDEPYHDNLTLRDWMARQVGLLPRRYAQLASALAPLAPPQRIFIGLYPDLLRDDEGNLCGTRTILTLNKREIQWMNDFFYVPLNEAVTAAAKAHDWTLVVGQPEAFRKHGYCAQKNHWIVRLAESDRRQGNAYGTLHPYRDGQAEIASLFYPQLSAVLNNSGSQLPPAPVPGAMGLAASLTQISNSHPGELTINPTSDSAVVDHTGQYGGAGNGGDWQIAYSWKLPQQLIPGQAVPITLSATASNVNPSQPLSFSINVLAPGLAQQLIVHYPANGPSSQTFQYTLAADEQGAKDIAVTIGFESSSVTYHYKSP